MKSMQSTRCEKEDPSAQIIGLLLSSGIKFKSGDCSIVSL